MVLRHNIKNCLTLKLTAVVVLSTILLCSPSHANEDFPYFALLDTNSIKNQSLIKLDTSRVENSTQINTSIPHKLRGSFDEADYFSSSIEDLPQINQNAPPVEDLINLPSPSEYQRKSSVNLVRNDIQEFAPAPEANNFFSPLLDSSEVVVESQKVPENIFENTQESTYTAFTEIEDDNLNLEGKKIASINIQGLNKLDSSFIKDSLKTQVGSSFNSEILQQDLQRLYSSGFFTDRMAIEPTLKSDNTVELNYVLEENIIISNVALIGNTVISTEELVPYVSNLKNLPQNLSEINNAISKIQECYHQKGYILANVVSVDDDAEGNLRFNIQEGVINQVNFSGNERTKDYVLQRNIMTHAGMVYNEEYLKKDLAKIFSTQIFDEVNRTIEPSEKNDGTFDVTVVVKEKSTNSIALGGGIDTGLGAFGSISLKEDNFMGRAQKLSLTGILGSGILLSDASIKNHMNYSAELNFFEPYFLNADNSLMSKLYFREMGSWNVPLAIERRIGLMAGVEHKVMGSENLSTTFTAGVEHINLKEGDLNRIADLYARNNLDFANRSRQLADGFFVNLSPGIKYVSLDDKEIPREGIIAQAQFTESLGVSNFNHTNGRLSGAVTKFIPVFKKSTISFTGKAGVKIHGDEMPEIMAYRLGGPYTIRGYRMNGVGSGESFVMGSAELATPLPFVDKLKWDIFKKMRLTFFVDAGKVFDPTISCMLYDRPEHAITAGIGLRLFIPGVGPISVDYGIPITNPGAYGSENGYFTFGSGGLNGYGY